MKKHLSAVFGGALGVLSCVPLFAHAAIDCSGVFTITDISSFLCSFSDLVGFTTVLVSALALLVFFWGLVKYLAVADDDKSKTRGKNIMGGGIVVIFVMFSIFGIVRFFQNSFDVTGDSTITPLQL